MYFVPPFQAGEQNGGITMLPGGHPHPQAGSLQNVPIQVSNKLTLNFL